jgi:signal peptidase II
MALGLQLGGAISNLSDRLAFGSVTDFISVGWWPVFNIADSSIVVGITILIAGIFYREKLSTRNEQKS